MNPLTRIATFAVAVVALGGVAAAAGSAVGPLAATQDHAEGQAHEGTHVSGGPTVAEEDGHDGAHGDEEAGSGLTPAGLQTGRDGYTLALGRTTYAVGRLDLRFRILDATGRPVVDFDPVHGKRMHVIVVDRDLDSFRHVHPTLAPDGTWSTRVRVPAAGDYRVFADFRAAGAASGLTLGHDIAVAGSYRPVPVPAVAASTTVDDYEVTLLGKLEAGRVAPVQVRIEKNGVPVRDLDPYLDAYGHLVALRVGDLAYLHVHPVGAPGDGGTSSGPDVGFGVEVPSTGTYRLFVDFKHAGRVRTAAFTASATSLSDDALADPTHGSGGEDADTTDRSRDAAEDTGPGHGGHSH